MILAIAAFVGTCLIVHAAIKSFIALVLIWALLGGYSNGR